MCVVLTMKYEYKFSTSYKIKKSPDGKLFATIGGSVVLWDACSGKKILSFSQIKNPSDICFSWTSKMLAAKNTSGRIALFDVENLRFLYSIQPTKSEGCELLFTPDDQYIISADWDGNVYTIDVAEKSVKMLKKDTLMYLSVDYKGNEFILHGRKTVGNLAHSFTEFCSYPFNDAQSTVFESKTEFDKVTFTEDRSKCAAVDYKNILIMDETLTHIYDSITMYNVKKKKARIEHAAWSPDGKRLAMIGQYADKPNTVKVIDCNTGDVIAQYEIPYACYAGFTDCGTQLLIGTWHKGYCVNINELQQDVRISEQSAEDIKKQIEENGLSAQLLRDVSESELLEALYAATDDLVMNTAKRLKCFDTEALKEIPELNRLTYLLYWFDNETNEGGLSQYIFNSSCDLCGPLKEAFALLNMPQHIAIIDKAIDLYQKGYNLDDPKWQRLDRECETIDENPLSMLYQYIDLKTVENISPTG